ncbi:MAG: carbohydrate ABC transporter permease [Ruminococcaceae bacterium]|nr:carbohydrate ABC transporter permease [Oscillospiraceae bacterium]
MKLLRTKKVSRSLGGNMLVLLFLLLFGIFTAIPIIYSVINSFKPINELFLYPPRFFVINPTVENYLSLFTVQLNSLVPFERYLFNSVFVAVVTTVVYIIIASLAAYPLSKFNFKGKALIMQIIIAAILFRPEVTAIPQYIIISKFKMVDTYFALIFPALAGSFGVFLMTQFMSTIPNEILESATIDGCSEYKVFWKLVMPMVKPAWLTLVIFTFQGIWNTTGVQFIYSENMKMLPLALSQISTSGIAKAGIASAVSVVVMIPPIAIFLLSQKSVIQTMAYSGLKG